MKISQWEGSNLALIAFERESISKGPASEETINIVKDILNSNPWCVSLDKLGNNEAPWNELPPEFVAPLKKGDYDQELTFLVISGNDLVLNSIIDFGIDLETLIFTVGEEETMKDMFENNRDHWDKTMDYITLLNKLRGARISQLVDAAYAEQHQHHHHHHDHDHDHHHN